MAASDEKAYFRKEVAAVRRKRDRLPPQSHVRSALTDGVIAGVAQRIETSTVHDLSYGSYPPSFGFVSHRNRRQIDALAVSCLDSVGLSSYGGNYEKAKIDYATLCSAVKEQLLLDELEKLHRLPESSSGGQLSTRNRHP